MIAKITLPGKCSPLQARSLIRDLRDSLKLWGIKYVSTIYQDRFHPFINLYMDEATYSEEEREYIIFKVKEAYITRYHC